MKKITSFLFMAFIALNSIIAQTFEIDGIAYKIISINTVEVSSKTSRYTGNIIIPEQVNYNSNNYSVTAIGDNAFDWCTSLTSITIPNSVTSIGEYAFTNCTSLTSVIIPNSVTAIKNMTFSYCFGLTSITIPSSVITIGDGAFFYCGILTSITIPNSVTAIGEWAFAYCSSLNSITIPKFITEIRNSVFWDCESLTSITIPNSVKSIGDYAFRSCFDLASITCYATVPPNLGDNVFYNVYKKNIPLYIPYESMNTYKNTGEWKEFNILPIFLNRAICQGDTITLSVFKHLDSYLWSTGDTTEEIKVSPAQTSTYILTGTIGGSTTIDTIIVTVDFVIPTANAGADQTIDIVGSATLTATGGSIYSWSNGATTATITVSPSIKTTYTVTVSDIACTATDNVTVTVLLPKIEVTPMRAELYNDNKKSNIATYSTTNQRYVANDYDLAVSVVIDTIALSENRKTRKNLKYASSIDWSSYDSEAKNQGHCGSCWNFSGIGLIENISKQIAGQQGIPTTNLNLSEQAILSCNSVVNNGCNGGWPIWVYNYAKKNGIPNETCFPYKAKDATNISCNTKPLSIC
ncbi:MAG: hypothetical protein A2X02_01040 [Bacteroidetes bacterium GWF2_29_10]|nr:MAG: hypothetical protein A2X02_01040 [Bacteroidetes bacterium GWF2_29_10]